MFSAGQLNSLAYTSKAITGEAGVPTCTEPSNDKKEKAFITLSVF